MKKRFHALKVLSSAAILSIAFSYQVPQASASTSESLAEVEGDAVAAYYYIDGKKIEIPQEDLANLLNEEEVYDLPYDPAEPTPPASTQLSAKEKAQAKSIGTLGNKCIPGYEYDARKISGAFENGKSGSRFANKTSSTVTKVSQLSTDKTIGGEVSASGDFTWGPVQSTVGFKINGSYTWRTAESSSLPIKPKKMGWVDYGTYKEKWTGDYYYLTSSCSETSKVSVTPKGPKYKLDVARESAIPPGV